MPSLMPILEKLSRILREAETTVLAVDLHVPRLLAAGVALLLRLRWLGGGPPGALGEPRRHPLGVCEG